jgi:CBS domain-containing protein
MVGKIVPDIVSDQTIYAVSEADTVRDAAAKMAGARISAVVVTEDDRLVGILTERDISAKVVAEGLDAEQVPVSDVMTPNPDTLAPDDPPASALELMRVRGYRHLPVVVDGRVVAMVSIRDLYAAVQSQLEEDVRQREAFIFDTGYGKSG